MLRKVLTLMVIPDQNSSKVRVISLPAFFVPLFIFVCALWVGLFVFFMWGSYWKAVEKSNLERLEMENGLLARKIEGMGSKVDSLMSEIDFLAEQGRALRLLADLPAIDEETRMVGVGGAALSYDELAFDLTDPAGLPASMGVNIDRLLREAALLKSSFGEIESKLREQKDVLNHTPTIMPTAGWFSSYFGRRRDPFTGRRQFHKGVDIANKRGTSIYATAAGTVKYYGYDKNFGRLLVIDHGYGFETRYGHVQKSLVTKGQKVERGQKIALMGNTGRSTSSHLHYEVKLNGRHQNPLNYFYADEVVD
ncbi:MAG: M23 family metallopeptidase [bacterium]